ncbi:MULTISPECIES: LysM peptidoglycan-binding domain-containing protein [unclassified Arthrobacter]|uniref:LysM peptidoglycan-binding domain-containing protein n=1 Tax=unclassified Arthrobacter TaxID=235627 RepID=UPI001D142E56|nr:MULTISPECIES: LysM peptidoglycan-binding domain-containing protein [unclassified Arthrobacter]MCC3291036.1 LysM peptidoglycan-binding domain-containing protein [Arthrobacter sp. zg-Y1110]MCC3301564.1 LysM peptidoglycan-binding domain-containing protein [Arthrobacter sp. zg-Y895]UWX86445.1 LysM peptidoglycan-binding domain-containing protein [Arthrobacter sp. zg-Y1110]
MTFNKTRGRHRAETIVVAGRGRTIGSAAAVVVAGSGLMLSMAAPASAGVVANDNYTPSQAVAPAAPVAAAPVAAAPVAAPAAAATTHTVVSGDTLGQISAAYGVGLDSVLALNGLSLASIIYPGDVITVAGEAAPAIAAEPVASYAAPAAAPAAAAPVEPANTGVVTTQSTNITPAAATPAASGTNAIMLASAQSQLGAAQDCTVLVEVALRAAGHSVGDLAPAQLAAYGTQVSTPEPGDMVYYADGGMGLAHIAIYIGNGEAIHSGWNGNQTVVQSVNVGSGPVFYRA